MKTNLTFKMTTLVRKNAADEIIRERNLERLHLEAFQKRPDRFGLRAEELAEMIKRHTRADFRDGVYVDPKH